MKALLTVLFFFSIQSVFAQTKIINSQYENGTLKKGYKDSIWRYYDKPGELALEINYSTAKLLYLKPDTSEFVIKINDQWAKSKLDAQPRYLGSMTVFMGSLQRSVRYPARARSNETAGKFYVTFEIDTIGRAGNYQVINDIGDDCGKEAINALKQIPNYWLPAQRNGKAYASKFILPLKFEMIVGNREIVPQKSKSTELPLAKALDELLIRTMSGPVYFR
ncbi:hypothetical protein GZH53_15560 [Flavihumibacter sp. R14]|nr:hypothetical protein [Flavihumibacter soli]